MPNRQEACVKTHLWEFQEPIQISADGVKAEIFTNNFFIFFLQQPKPGLWESGTGREIIYSGQVASYTFLPNTRYTSSIFNRLVHHEHLRHFTVINMTIMTSIIRIGP